MQMSARKFVGAQPAGLKLSDESISRGAVASAEVDAGHVLQTERSWTDSVLTPKSAATTFPTETRATFYPGVSITCSHRS